VPLRRCFSAGSSASCCLVSPRIAQFLG
jgi:hypothetical protein